MRKSKGTRSKILTSALAEQRNVRYTLLRMCHRT